MDSKYYIPDETEYHIGFEYQSLTDERFPDDDKSWSDEIIDSIKDLRDVCHYLIVDDFIEHRVKFLDIEDIESLGFIFTKRLGGLTEYYEIKGLNRRLCEQHDDTMYWNVYLRYYVDIHVITITADISDGSENEKFFEGIIKNKSEFKKLLTQLNII